MLRLFRRDRDQNAKQTSEAVQPTRQRWFGRILGLLRSSGLSDEVWEELEEILISSDVGVDTSLRIIQEVRDRVKQEDAKDPEQVFLYLKESLVAELDLEGADQLWLEEEPDASPYVILMVGVNGVGKTTSIAKLAQRFTKDGKRVILGAADTFRAAAIEQLEILGQQVGVDVISHQFGADPGAVAYDAYQASKARGADVLIVDTAGRLHTKSNLMEELKKVDRVLKRLDPAAPHQVILTLDATTGHNGLAQAKSFKDAVGCTGIFLAKLDGTARGGVVLAIKHELQVPIMFIGTGEKLDDLASFDSKEFVDSLLAPVSS
ncbi:MAG: signal recognition particle-docking protein FtsY [SAR202 cluster bacterium Io17-Chloro-G9]|nr:MAG: signal recognition particle-docking protein FtsY [SAR202 cluster bacterium Io17-Chloro-G9]